MICTTHKYNSTSSSSWGDIQYNHDKREEQRILDMSDAEFDALKLKYKRDKRFCQWRTWVAWCHRLQEERERHRNPPQQPTYSRTRIDELFAIRHDYIHFPAHQFASTEDQDRAVRKIDADIIRNGGLERLTRTRAQEKEDAQSELDELVHRVNSVKRIREDIAATRIARFLRKHARRVFAEDEVVERRLELGIPRMMPHDPDDMYHGLYNSLGACHCGCGDMSCGMCIDVCRCCTYGDD